MQQAALLDGLGFDLLSLSEDGFGPSELDVGGCEITHRLSPGSGVGPSA